MPVDGFNEMLNVVYIAKKLHDMDKYDLVTESFFDTLDLDCYYENMYSLIPNLFDYHRSDYYDRHAVELLVIADSVIVDFYVLAGKYGKCNNVADDANPYIKAAEQETHDNLNFCHCLDWKLMGHTEPVRKYHSRLGLFISHDCGCLDLGVLAYRLIVLHEWFADMCVELQEKLREDASGQLMLDMGVMAA